MTMKPQLKVFSSKVNVRLCEIFNDYEATVKGFLI